MNFTEEQQVIRELKNVSVMVNHDLQDVRKPLREVIDFVGGRSSNVKPATDYVKELQKLAEQAEATIERAVRLTRQISDERIDTVTDLKDILEDFKSNKSKEFDD